LTVIHIFAQVFKHNVD